MDEKKKNELMYDATKTHKRVKINIEDGSVIFGYAEMYIRRDDDENGRAGIGFYNEGGSRPYITEDEIIGIEYVS